MKKVAARRTIENSLRRYGFMCIAGVDEVGRGCLAGPVMAGAVVLDPARHIPGLADSKALTAAGRDRLFYAIVARAAAGGVAAVGPDEVGVIDIPPSTVKGVENGGLAV